MRVELEPFSSVDFKSFVPVAVKDYAREIERANGFSRAEALRRSRKEFKSLLPKGLRTPKSFFFNPRVAGVSKPVGTLWLSCSGRKPNKRAYIYDIRVHRRFQGKGYGRLTMQAVDRWAKGVGAGTVGLNVFAHNKRAHSLYLSCGYEERAIKMSKKI